MGLPWLLVIAFAGALVGALLWTHLASHFRWFDHPNHRSSHRIPTPTSGGIAIVITYVACTVWSGYGLAEADYLALFASLLLSLLGITDDFRNLGIRLRLFLQFMAVGMLLPLIWRLPALQIGSLFVIEGRALAMIVAFGSLWFVNLFNFMDGIDGLAATQAIFLAIAIQCLSMGKGYPLRDFSLLILAASCCGFLLFNFPRGKLFMGDIGSYFLGFTLIALGMRKIVAGELSFWAFVILIGTFVVDSSTTLLGRLRSGAVWYHPHRSHAYQLLAHRWASHERVVLLNLVINLVWLLPLAWWAQANPNGGVWALLVAWAPLALMVWLVRNRLAVSSPGVKLRLPQNRASN